MSRLKNEQSICQKVTKMVTLSMHLKDIVHIDKEICNGQPVFLGTRVPVDSLFDHLEAGISIDEFLEDFPTVRKEQAVGLLEIASQILTSTKADQFYETLTR